MSDALEQICLWDIEEYKIWKGINPSKPVWARLGFACSRWDDAHGLMEYMQRNSPESLLRVNRRSELISPENAPDTRDALIKELVRVKPLVFNQRASGWWAMSPFGFYVVAPTKTDNGDQWGIWYPETATEDDPDGYASNEGAAMAVSQHAYERRILSAVEAIPASQIRAEALREAGVVACGYPGGETICNAILALIDAPKVTT